MAAERIEETTSDDVLAGRGSLRGWVSGGMPRTGEIVQFPDLPAKNHTVFDTDSYVMEDHWTSIAAPIETADDLRFEILAEQEGIDPSQTANDRITHEHMLAENGGLHNRANRYPSGFRSWDDHIS